jgi:hypothetical protein
MRQISMMIRLALLLLLSTVSCSREQTEDHEIGRLLPSAFVDADFSAVLERIHCPPTYSDQECVDDRSGVVKGLEFLVETLGAPSKYSGPSKIPYVAYNIGAFGGDLAYWESISPFNTHEVVYEAEFPHYGSALIRVTLFRPADSDRTEIYEAGVSLPAQNPRAIREAATLTLGLAETMGVDLSEAAKEFLIRSISPKKIRGSAD